MKFILLIFGIFTLAAEAKEQSSAGASLLGRYNKAEAIALVEVLEVENLEVEKVPGFGKSPMQKKRVKILKLWKSGQFKVGEVISGYSGTHEKVGEKLLTGVHEFRRLRENEFDKAALQFTIQGDEAISKNQIGFLDHISKAKNEAERAKMAKSYALKKIKEIEEKYKNSSINYEGEIRYWK